MKDLPVEYFRNLCEADNLYIEDEKIVVNLIEEYLNHRKDLPLLPEELPQIDPSLLTEEEKKKREEEEKKKHEEAKKAKDEEEKKELDAFNALD